MMEKYIIESYTHEDSVDQILFYVALLIFIVAVVIPQNKKRKEEFVKNFSTENQEFKVGDRVTVQRDGYGAIILRKGMTGTITEIASRGRLGVQFDGHPFECMTEKWIFRK